MRALAASIPLAVPAPLQAAVDPVGPGQFLQVLAGLAIVLALIAAATWAARRVQGWRPQGGGHIRVIEGLAVGTREKLLLVEVDDRRVLIGMCPGRMQALATLPPARGESSFAGALATAETETA